MPSATELLSCILGVLLLVAIWLGVTRSQRRAVRETDALFERLGFLPPETNPNDRGSNHIAATSYVGTYRGHEAGFTQGALSTIGIAVDSEGSTTRSGSEFWVALGFSGPAFMLVERDETRSAELAGFCSMDRALPTGDAAFDARFQVYCEHESWGRWRWLEVLARATNFLHLAVAVVQRVNALEKNRIDTVAPGQIGP